ncbi:hypothetical protein BaRGS_00004053, partial [Batillaria attramentaria]
MLNVTTGRDMLMVLPGRDMFMLLSGIRDNIQSCARPQIHGFVSGDADILGEGKAKEGGKRRGFVRKERGDAHTPYDSSILSTVSRRRHKLEWRKYEK